MSAVTAHNLETPSKKVAAGLAGIDVNATPTKKVGKFELSKEDAEFDEPNFLAKGKKDTAAANKAASTDAAEEEDVHGKFVGDVDLPEEEEPLLVESSRRFVLFPIRYHEVSNWLLRSTLSLPTRSGMDRPSSNQQRAGSFAARSSIPSPSHSGRVIYATRFPSAATSLLTSTPAFSTLPSTMQPLSLSLSPSSSSSTPSLSSLSLSIDLANVQEGRGVVLDCRGD